MEAQPPELKKCSKCGLRKPLAEFHKDRSKRSGRDSHCRGCSAVGCAAWRKANHDKEKARVAAWRKANPDKDKAHKAAWRKANPDRAKAHRRKYAYGLSTEAYDQLLLAQEGRCAICRRLPEERRTSGDGLCVDHDHETSQVRGLLCGKCNTMIAYAHDNPGLLREAADYLERYQLPDDLSHHLDIGQHGIL